MYIREAHPSDGWQVGANTQQGVVYTQPTTEKERLGVAHACQVGLKISIPMLVDGMDNAVNNAYTAWPDRLYVVGKDGTIAYKGGPGPRGFQPAEMKQALEKMFKGQAGPR